jgi:hypothetical protein
LNDVGWNVINVIESRIDDAGITGVHRLASRKPVGVTKRAQLASLRVRNDQDAADDWPSLKMAVGGPSCAGWLAAVADAWPPRERRRRVRVRLAPLPSAASG